MTEMARPLEFQVGGRQVACSQCGGHGFRWHGYGMMGTRFKPIIEGYALECATCSHLEFFARRPEEV
ncbi:MAG: hypothetical protein RI897_75 [Verrucomicrobiota bacterium]|jgi:DNA-directed RNA polymerase subunit RPC12/RpoP